MLGALICLLTYRCLSGAGIRSLSHLPTCTDMPLSPLSLPTRNRFLTPNRQSAAAPAAHSAVTMASLLVKEQEAAILQDGFWTKDDRDVGSRVDPIARHGHLKSEEGLVLCNNTAIVDPVSWQLARKQLYLTILNTQAYPRRCHALPTGVRSRILQNVRPINSNLLPYESHITRDPYFGGPIVDY